MGGGVKSMNELFKKAYAEKLSELLGMVVLRPKSEKDLSAFPFVEEDDNVVYKDTNGVTVPLDKVVIETTKNTFKIKIVPRNPLSEVMCTPLFTTENFYVVKKP